MPQYTNQAVQAGYTKMTNITPSDTASVPPGTKAIMAEGAGALAVMMPGAATPFVIAAVVAGVPIPIAPVKVMATGTTATNIVAMG